MAALPSLRLLPPTPTARRTLFSQLKTLHPVMSNAATVTAAASQKEKWLAASVWLVTWESCVKKEKVDKATWVWSWVSSSSLLDWWLLLLFSLRGRSRLFSFFLWSTGLTLKMNGILLDCLCAAAGKIISQIDNLRQTKLKSASIVKKEKTFQCTFLAFNKKLKGLS